MKEFIRGDIYLVKPLNTSDSKDTQYHKVRPAIIVSNNIGNRHSNYITVIYLTSKRKKNNLPTHVRIKKFGTAMCEQMFTIHKNRCVVKKGSCNENELSAINKALDISLGLNEKINL